MAQKLSVFRTYVLVMLCLIILMFLMLYRDSNQHHFYSDADDLSITTHHHHARDRMDRGLQHNHIRTPSPVLPAGAAHFDDPNTYRDAHGHDHDHEQFRVAHDIEDDDESHEFQADLPLVNDLPWGQQYDRPRLVCLVPTLWPKKKFVMEVECRKYVHPLSLCP